MSAKNDITVSATSLNVSNTKTIGAAGGMAAVGTSIATANANGSVKAYVTGTVTTARDLKVTAYATDSAKAESYAVAGGIVSGSGSVATAIVSPVVEAYATGSLTTTRAINVSATVKPRAEAYAFGIAAGGLSVGVSNATAKTTPTVNAYVGGTLTTGSLSVQAMQVLPSAGESAYANATGSAGALIGVASTSATAINGTSGSKSAINAYVADSSTLTVRGATSVVANANSKQKADANSYAGGIVAAGIAQSKAQSDTQTSAYLGTGVKLDGGSLTITALGYDDNVALTTAGSGGVLAGAGATADTSNLSNTTALIKDGTSNRNITLGANNVLPILLISSNANFNTDQGSQYVNNGQTVDVRSAHTAGGDFGTRYQYIGGSGTIDLSNENFANTARWTAVGVIDGTGKLSMTADHTAKFNSTIGTVAGGALAGSGATSNHLVNAITTAGVGSNVKLYSKDISITSTSHVLKPEQSEANIKGVTGGIASAAGATSETVIKLDTRVEIGNNSVLQVRGYAVTAGDLRLAALNDIVAFDKVTLTTGGAISGAGAFSTIRTDGSYARVNIGTGTQLLTVGAIDISARGTGVLSAIVNAETYGAATVAVAKSVVDVRPVNEVNIGQNALLQADANVNISSGTNVTFDRDYYKLTARTDTFAGSAIPIDDVDSRAVLYQTNTITVASGANIRSARDINLHTERLGYADMTSRAKATNWASAIGDALSGSEWFGGYLDTNADGIVTVNGKLETGIARTQSLTLNWSQSASTNYGIVGVSSGNGITYRIVNEALLTGLAKELQNAQSQLNAYRDSGNTTLISFYTSEIARIKAALAAEGLTDDRGNLLQKSVPTIYIDPIWAQAGVIDIRADILKGSGTMDAPGDASVVITNNTPAFIKIMGITIPESNGGLFLNGVSASSNSKINELNSATSNGASTTATFASITQTSTGSVPTIVVRNTFNPNSVQLTADQEPYSSPGITVLGTITNLGGNLSLVIENSNGDIQINAQVRAKNMAIVAGGNVYIDGVTAYSVGGEAYSAWKTITDRVLASAPLGQKGVVDATTMGLANTQAYAAASTGTVVGYKDGAPVYSTSSMPGVNLYADRIHITAQYLNVNGVIQSGKDNYTLTIGASTRTEIQNISASATGLVYLNTASNSDFSVYWDVANKRIQVQEVRVSGGYIELDARITNTGKGEIRLLGGYANVTIDNQTTYDLVIQRIDTSARGTGKLLIVDRSKAVYSGSTKIQDFTVTLYEKAGDKVTVTVDEGRSTGAVSTVVNNLSNYNLAQGQRYGWSIGQEVAVRKMATVGRSDWLGIDWLAADPARISWDTQEAMTQPKLMGGAAYYYTDTSDTSVFDYDYNKVVTSTKNYETNQHTTSTWYGKRTRWTTFVEEQKSMEIHTFSIRADHDIAINFIGNGASDVTVKSGGSILLNGAISNASGTTTLIAGNRIDHLTDSAYVGGQIINLTATNGIGTKSLSGADTPIQGLNTDLSATPTYDFTTSSNKTQIANGVQVKLAAGYSAGGVAGKVYKYIGADTSLNLSTQNYGDASKWQLVNSNTVNYTASNPNLTVQGHRVLVGNGYANGGEAGQVYSYIGAAGKLDLSTQDYSDTSKWQKVESLPAITATASNGAVYLNEIIGDLAVKSITAGVGREISLTAQGSIVVAKATAATWTEGRVGAAGQRGGSITLNALNGSIGIAGHALTLYSGSTQADRVIALAAQNIYLTEGRHTGTANGADNLRIEKVESRSTNGTVEITVSNGSLIDANNTQQVDERAKQDLIDGVWSDLQLTADTGANTKVSETILAYKTAKEQDYRTYWSYRGQQADPSVYDADFQVTLTAAQRDYYVNTLGYSAAQITTLENKVTAEYRELHARYGSAGNSYNANYSWNITSGIGLQEVNNITAGIKIWTAEELMSTMSAGLLKPVANTQINIEEANIIGHNVKIVTSHAVGANSGPITIDLVNRPQPLQLTEEEKLAFAMADRIDVTYLAGNPVSNVTVNFNADGTITRTGTSWNSTDLKVGMHIQISGATANATDKGVSYQIKSITDTTVNGVLTSTIKLTSSADLTTETGKIVTITPIALNPTRSDVVSSVVNFTMVNGVPTIVRTDGGDWLADGFTAGQQFQIMGNSANVSARDSYYTIASVTEGTITLIGSNSLTAESSMEAVFTPKVSNTAALRPALTAIVIERRDDINVDATGRVNVSAGTTVYLGSGEMQNAMQIDNVTSTSNAEIRIKSRFGIVNDASVVGNANVIGGDLIVEAGKGAIGSSTKAFLIDLQGTATLTARASGNLYIAEKSGNMYVAGVSSTSGIVNLEARSGSILDGIAGSDTPKIAGNRIELKASDAIGLVGNALKTDLTPQGTLKADAQNGIYLYETLGDLNVDGIKSIAGDVYLKARGSIVDAGNDGSGLESRPGTDVFGRSITLIAENGAIGRSGNDLDIQAGFSGAAGDGTLTTSSMFDTNIIQVLGDLYINEIGTGVNAVGNVAYTAFIASPGSILNGRNDGNSNLTSGKASLFATNNIGSSSKSLNSKVGVLQGTSTTGGTWISNKGAMELTRLDGSAGAAIKAGGAVTITTASPMNITRNIESADSITLIALDDATGDVDDITIAAGVTVQSTNSFVHIKAGDDVSVAATAKVIAKGELTIEADYQGDVQGNPAPAGQANKDSYGAIITIAGQLKSDVLVDIRGESQADTIKITGSITAPIVRIDGAQDDDLIEISGSINATTSISIKGSEGNDTLRVTSTGVINTAVFVLDAGNGNNTVELLGDLDATTSASINTGSGNDQITIAKTLNGGSFTLNAGDGTNVIKLQAAINVADATITSGSGADDISITGKFTGTSFDLNAGDGDNVIAVSNDLQMTGAIGFMTGSGKDNISLTAPVKGLSFTLDAGNGDNTILISSTVAMTTGAVSITTGSGKDKIDITDDVSGGSFALVAGDGDNTIAISGAIDVAGAVALMTGSGTDDIRLSGAVDGASFTLDAGNGDNTVIITNTVTMSNGAISITTGSGKDNIDITRSISGGSFALNAGDGENTIAISDAITMTGAVNLTTGSGHDDIRLTAPVTGTTFTLQAGDGVNGLLISSAVTMTGAVSITTGSGADSIDVTGSIAGAQFDLSTGAGADTITITGNIDTAATTFDLGADNDALRMSGTTKVASLTVRADDGDDLIELWGSLEAATTIDLHGGDGDDVMRVWGSVKAVSFMLNGDGGNDTIALNPEHATAGFNAAHDLALMANTFINGGAGEDTLLINHLAAMTTSHNGTRDQIRMDGGGGTDQYIVNMRGGSDYIVSINDSGLPNDGADQLTINGTDNDDTFLLRRYFVASLDTTGLTGDAEPRYTNKVERINYNETVNGRLLVNGLDGDDAFYVDDNSTITTLDGGSGKDRFQFGQVFGADRVAPYVAAGDEVETVQTTLGYLTRGISYATTAFGGDGNDSFVVYSNKAPLKLFGEDGNDEFIVRAFALADTNGISVNETEVHGGAGDDHVEYNINAPVSIDGGSGVDTVVVIGTEKNDNFVITETGVQGAGLNIDFTGIERLEIDGMEGDDHFFILGTPASVSTTIIGGLGNDTFSVGGDVTKTIVASSVEGTSGFINHAASSTDPAYNGIYVEGVKLNVANAVAGAIAIRQQTAGEMLLTEDATDGSNVSWYEVAMNVPPSGTEKAYVTVSATQATTKDTALGGKSIEVSIDGVHYYQSLVLTFDPSAGSGAEEWARTQKVYVRAASDTAAEGERVAMISHSVMSNNPTFNELQIANVQVRVIDNDMPALIIRQTDGNTRVTEGDANGDTYSIALTKAPAAGEIVKVKLGLDAAQLKAESFSSDPAIASRLHVDAQTGEVTLTFDSSNWNEKFIVKLTAINDSIPENRATEVISHVISSTGGGQGAIYQNLVAQTLNVEVSDDDVGGVIVTQSSGTTLVSATADDTYTLALSRQPTAPVTITLMSDGKTILSAADPSDTRFGHNAQGLPTVTFTAADWNIPFMVNVEMNPAAATTVGTTPIQTYPQQQHVVAKIKGSLFIEGSNIEGRDRSLRQAVMLPGETDTALPQVNNVSNESTNTDSLIIYNDGSVSNDTGKLGKVVNASGLAALLGVDVSELTPDYLKQFGVISGLGMGGSFSLDFGTPGNPDLRTFDGGITYHGMEIVNVLLGKGNDTFTVDHTVDGSVTVVQGGGGDDHLIVTGGGGAAAPLVLFGDTSQDGSFYNVTVPGQPGGFAFTNFGNDIIDARGASGRVIVYGGRGDDTIYGSAYDDILAGGSGNDTIRAGGGNNFIYGDSGLNIDLSKRLSVLGATMLTVVNENTSNTATYDNLAVGNDTIYGSTNGSDVIVADHGEITQIGNNKMQTNALVKQVNSFYSGTVGGSNTITTTAGNGIVIGGAGLDTITVGGVSNIVIGDHGKVLFDATDTTKLVSIETTNVTVGSKDVIKVTDGDSIVFGGIGADEITTANGRDMIFGDNGIIEYSSGIASVLRTTDQSEATGGADIIKTGNGNKLVLGGIGSDTVELGLSGSTTGVVIGDNGKITLDAGGTFAVKVESADYLPVAGGLGGDDTIKTGNGDHLIIGGFGTDRITTADGNDTILGDNGVVTLHATTGKIITIDASLDVATSGAGDIIVSGHGDKFVVGGMGGDKITVGNGDGILIGDNGIVTFDADGIYAQIIESTDYLAGLGGNDKIEAGNGNHFVIGGYGEDTITTGIGNDVILGDNGKITLNANGKVTELDASTDVASSGAKDIIVSGNGNKFVIGGIGGDEITVGNGDGILIGDNGVVTFDANGIYAQVIESTDYLAGLGGNDKIEAGNGNHFVIGGYGEDTITTGVGNDVILGDNGRITLNANGKVTELDASTDVASSGAKDIIVSGNGNKFVIGGIGGDDITVGNGDGILIGDNGIVTFDADGVYAQVIESTDYLAGLGGNDKIEAGNGNHFVIGGYGEDTITTGIGNDVILGDNGKITLNANGKVTELDASTDVASSGAKDIIISGDGNKFVIGGIGGDEITVGNGDGILIGDNGVVTFDANGIYAQVIESTGYFDDLGGDDTISAGNGNHYVIGGYGADTITLGNGNDVVLGDNGQISLNAAGSVVKIDASFDDNTTGAGDTILVGDGSKYLVGGAGNDTITAGVGAVTNGVILGDNGVITLDASGSHLARIETTDYLAGIGGNDTITTGDGNHYVLGGIGNDAITTGTGNDFLFGDNGVITFNTAGIATRYESFMDNAVSGGNDTIVSIDGDKHVIAGYGNDSITLGNGNNIAFGDNGRVTLSDTGVALTISSIDPAIGGNDTIVSGDGRNVLVGGIGNDTIKGGDGGNVIFGDNGDVTRDMAGKYVKVVTTNPTIGGNDLARGGNGEDVILGGNGDDELFGYDGFNIVIGDSALVEYTNGRVSLAQTIDLYDGGSDILHGGKDLSVLFGGAKGDLLHGNFTRDVMAGDYAAIYFVDGQAKSVVRFGQEGNSPDLIAASQDVVFTTPANREPSHATTPASRALIKQMDELIASISAPQQQRQQATDFSMQQSSLPSARSSESSSMSFESGAQQSGQNAQTPSSGNASTSQSQQPSQSQQLSPQAQPNQATPPADAAPAAPETQGVSQPAVESAAPQGDVPAEQGEPAESAPQDEAGLPLDGVEMAFAGLAGAHALRGGSLSRKDGALQFDPRTGTWSTADKHDQAKLDLSSFLRETSALPVTKAASAVDANVKTDWLAGMSGVNQVVEVVKAESVQDDSRTASIDWNAKKETETTS
ncbi:hypothetical protein [uncultured Oxalicibacterium sp.]|uniref:beta strand repeat-containing protein n=1 Tax=uncultured Oxalicibacterium sp. TaxID=1168540 RepID=UPI0025EA775A|nr:hypothetical protein [uncultured Oxalicibacterium sp.]